jgi:hypothetical protein
MKFLGLLASAFLAVLVSCGANAASFMPENDLWKEDCLGCESIGMTQELFQKIVDAGKQAYAPNAKANKEKLIINAKWEDPTVNANCGRQFGMVTVNMYGGLFRRPEMSPEGFALVLGHELNHAYGNAPYYPQSNKLSAEGQADYMATKDAYVKIAKLVPELNQEIFSTDFIKNVCKNVKKTKKNMMDSANCEHSLLGGQSLGNLLAALGGDPMPNYETPDPYVTDVTLTSYPATTQCRLDTYLAGTLGNSRPTCWFLK